MKELWKSVIGYENNYEVSNKGRVRGIERKVQLFRNRKPYQVNTFKPRILKTAMNKKGYLTVSLSLNNRKSTLRIHRLVAIAFCEGKESGLEVCHKDGNKLNNVSSNLRWDTPENNVLDRVKHGYRKD